ncbi:hypothetical protein COO60DRAFT_1500153, partial [Scenedesmus sp. NREL 46B-D3]
MPSLAACLPLFVSAAEHSKQAQSSCIYELRACMCMARLGGWGAPTECVRVLWFCCSVVMHPLHIMGVFWCLRSQLLSEGQQGCTGTHAWCAVFDACQPRVCGCSISRFGVLAQRCSRAAASAAAAAVAPNLRWCGSCSICLWARCALSVPCRPWLHLSRWL